MTVLIDRARDFLTQFFHDEEFNSLCRDYFRDVYDSLCPDMSLVDRFSQLIGYVELYKVTANLLAALQITRPPQYVEWFPDNIFPDRVLQRDVPACERDPHRIFISYAYQDHAVAERLRKDLSHPDLTLWYKPVNIRPGELWVHAIERGLKTSGIFIAVVTSTIVRFPSIQDEIEQAMKLERYGFLRVFFLEIDDYERPVSWNKYPRISFKADQSGALKTLLAALRQTPTSGSAPSELLTGTNRPSLQMIFAFEPYSSSVRCLSLSADGLRLACGLAEGIVWIHQTVGPMVKVGRLRPSPGTIINSVLFLPNSLNLLTGDDAGQLLLWNGATSQKLDVLSQQPVAINALALLDGVLVASMADGRLVLVKHHSADTWEKIESKVDTRLSQLASMTAALNGLRLAVTGDDEVQFMAKGDHKFPELRFAFPYTASALAISHNGVQTAVSINDAIYFWGTDDGLATDVISFESEEIRSLAFSPTSKWLAAGTASGWVYVIETSTRRLAAMGHVHMASVNCMTFTEDSSALITGSDDQTVCVWNVAALPVSYRWLTRSRRPRRHWTRAGSTVAFNKRST